MSVLEKQKRAHIESPPTLISINFSKHFRYVNDVPTKVLKYQVFLKTDTTQEYIDYEVHLCFGSEFTFTCGQNLKVKMYVHRHGHNVYYTCSAALCFVLDPTLFNLQSPTYTCTWCMFSLAGCEGRTSPMCTLGLSESQRVHQSLGQLPLAHRQLIS